MAERNTGNSTLKIVAPIILAVISLIGVIVQSDWFEARMMPAASQEVVVTEIVVNTSDTEVNDIEMSSSDVATEPAIQDLPATETNVDDTPATDTPVLLPIEDIFPQIGTGEDFDYVNNPATFAANIANGDCVHTGDYGLKIVYDVKNSGNGGWGVLWTNTVDGTIDFVEYSDLVFWVKGGTGNERFQVTITDSLQQADSMASNDMLVLSRDWQEVRVPLSRFPKVNFSLLENMVFDFNVKGTGGQVCIDDISFE